MYAVIQIGTRQYVASEGASINIDKIDKNPGEKIIFENVLLIDSDNKITLGDPSIKGAQIKATVDSHIKDKKVIAYRYKNKTRSGTKRGHKQDKTQITINKIVVSAKKTTSKK